MNIDEGSSLENSSVPIEIKKQEIDQNQDVPIQKKQENSNEIKQNMEEDPKTKLKVAVTKLFAQMKQGCKKDICFNKYCMKNPYCKN